MLRDVSGDLLDLDSHGCQYIAQQCNCVTKEAKGLSAAIFEKFPEANEYARRALPSTPGTIQVFGPVINMYAQYNPGSPRRRPDTAERRIEWFQACLEEIGRIPGVRSVAFAHGIGCGLARGNWDTYRAILKEWADQSGVDIVIVKQ